MAKQFKSAAQAARPVYHTIIGSISDTQEVQNTLEKPDVQQELYVPKAQEVQKTSSTQGRKGAHMPRINMAFPPENLQYLRVMAALQGESITRYVNGLVEKDMLENEEVYQAAQSLATKKVGR